MIAERAGRGSPVEFYERELSPLVFEQLDRVFPEFGFVRDARGWRATNDGATRSVFAARADRVVCHRPGGFLVFGAEPVRWLALVAGEERPTGRAFVEAVRELARRTGIDTTPIDTPRVVPELRQVGEAIRDAVFDVAQRTLKDKRHNQAALAYLARRGIQQSHKVLLKDGGSVAHAGECGRNRSTI